MKKTYSSPYIEKIEFDYKNVIVTSGGGCRTGGSYSDYGDGCTSTQEQWKADVN